MWGIRRRTSSSPSNRCMPGLRRSTTRAGWRCSCSSPFRGSCSSGCFRVALLIAQYGRSPLHGTASAGCTPCISTFALVAALQMMYSRDHSSYFVYQFNDSYHALLNLFLAPAWGLEKGWSFNAPIWSVSVEVLLYGSFFLICLAGKGRWLLAAGAAGLGAFLYPDYYKVGSGILCFYLGGVTYGLLERLRRYAGDKATVAITSVSCLGAWIYVAYGTETISGGLVISLCFPLTVATLAAIGYRWPGLLRSCAWLGDISFSSYLIHFPLQIIFAMALDGMGLPRSVFYQSWVLLLFFAALMPLSFLSHRLLERPAQRYLREQGLGSRLNWRSRSH